jgi:hypothetical protein
MAAAAAAATAVPRCNKREGDIAGAGTSVSLSDLLHPSCFSSGKQRS